MVSVRTQGKIMDQQHTTPQAQQNVKGTVVMELAEASSKANPVLHAYTSVIRISNDSTLTTPTNRSIVEPSQDSFVACLCFCNFMGLR